MPGCGPLPVRQALCSNEHAVTESKPTRHFLWVSVSAHLSAPPANFKKKVLIPVLAAAWTCWTHATLIQHFLMANGRPVLQGELIFLFKHLLTRDHWTKTGASPHA